MFEIPDTTIGIAVTLAGVIAHGIWRASNINTRFEAAEKRVEYVAKSAEKRAEDLAKASESRALEERRRVESLARQVSAQEERVNQTMRTGMAELGKSLAEVRELVAGINATLNAFTQRNRGN